MNPKDRPPASAAPLLECREVDICIGTRTLVRRLNLQVRAGSLLAVLGPNGAGKSLSLHTFAGLRPPASGDCWWAVGRSPTGRAGRSHANSPSCRKMSKIRFPRTSSRPCCSDVIRTSRAGSGNPPEDLAIASNALAAVGLAGYEEREIYTLSGGERRRAALAAVLAQTPRLFLLDEPTNQLDPNHQLEALSLLRERADAGAAVVVTLHDPSLAARFADHALLIGKGGDWRCGTAAETSVRRTCRSSTIRASRSPRSTGDGCFF